MKNKSANQNGSVSSDPLIFRTNGTMTGGFTAVILYNTALAKKDDDTRNKDGCTISNNCAGANCGNACGIKNPF
jgi:hypothetical protein